MPKMIKLAKNISLENRNQFLTLKNITYPYLIEPVSILYNSLLSEMLRGTGDNQEGMHLCNTLKEIGILYDSRSTEQEEYNKYNSLWKQRGNNISSLFHQFTNNIPKLDYSAKGGKIDFSSMKKKVKVETLPSNYKNIKTDCRINLINSEPDQKYSVLEDVFNNHSVFDEPILDPVVPTITLAELDDFLYHLLGQTAIRSMIVTGEHVAKTSPSGGSRHPTEGYIDVFDIQGIKSGLYHYNVHNHSLDRIREEHLSDVIRDAIFRFRLDSFEPSFIIYLSTIFERSMFRYRESRSYRVVNIDLGHIMQTATMLAIEREWDIFKNYSPPENLLEERIGLDGFFESIMTAIAVNYKKVPNV